MIRNVSATTRGSADQPPAGIPATAGAAPPSTDTGTTAEKPAAAPTSAGAGAAGRPGRWTRLRERFPILKKKRGIAILCAVPLVLLSGLAGLAALPGKSSGGRGGPSDDGVTRDDAEFYGLSPAVYPSRKVPHISIYCFLSVVTDMWQLRYRVWATGQTPLKKPRPWCRI